MHALSITTLTATLAALASAAPLEVRDVDYAGPTGTGSFALQVIAIGGNLSYSGMFLDTYHTGAGANVLVAVDGQEHAQTYNFTKKTGDVSAILGSYPYSLTLTSQDIFAAPKGYSFFGFDVGAPAHSNFTFSTPGNYLQFAKGDDYTMAICPAEIYSKGYYEPTLVYRSPDAKKKAKCADVMVKAIF